MPYKLTPALRRSSGTLDRGDNARGAVSAISAVSVIRTVPKQSSPKRSVPIAQSGATPKQVHERAHSKALTPTTYYLIPLQSLAYYRLSSLVFRLFSKPPLDKSNFFFSIWWRIFKFNL